MIYQVRFVDQFKDGNLFPRTIKQGEVIEIEDWKMAQVRASGGHIEVLGARVPKPEGGEKKTRTRKASHVEDIEAKDESTEETKP